MDRPVQEVVPVNQCIQNRFPGDPPGDVRKLHLLEARDGGGAHPRVGVQQRLDLIGHFEKLFARFRAERVESALERDSVDS